MSFLNTQLYRIIVPKYFRKRILARVLKSKILDFYADPIEPVSDEIEEVLGYLRNRKIAMFPYYFQDKYIENSIEVFDDKELGLRYVLQDGKRLYFKKRWSKSRIRLSFNELMKEQDLKSPHCYEKGDFKVDEGDVLVDIGAAEGNYALSNVEKASRIILFESNKEWLEPLRATFAPWKEKVTIVNKFVGDVSNAKCITLDDYFSQGEKVTFLKIDVEGAESSLLKGCTRILSVSNPLKVAICTYHKQGDELELGKILSDYGFQISHSDGYMLVYTDRKLNAPYFRRGLIRAIRR
jgi:hypothetical protein